MTFLVGCVILASPTLTLTIVLWVFIAGFIITAIYYFLKFYKDKDRKNIIQITLAIIAIIYGVVMIIDPLVGANTLSRIIASFTIFNEISYMIKEK